MYSTLLNRGRATVEVFPEVEVVNARGTVKKVPSEEPVLVSVTISSDQSQVADLPGQIEVRVIRCVARSAPVGTWARVRFEGEEYDLTIPPHRSPGASRASAHVAFTIRSRSNLGVKNPGG